MPKPPVPPGATIPVVDVSSRPKDLGNASAEIGDSPPQPASFEEENAAQGMQDAVQSAMGVGKPTDFKVSLQKATKDVPVGLELDTVGGSIAMVTRILEGMVNDHNKTASSDQAINVGHFIMEVNGIAGDTKQMGLQAVQSASLDLLVRRPAMFTVQLNKANAQGSLGIEFEYLSVGKSLLIREINRGLIEDWNQIPGNVLVVCGDRIVGVNSFQGESDKMLQMIRDQEVLTLTMARI